MRSPHRRPRPARRLAATAVVIAAVARWGQRLFRDQRPARGRPRPPPQRRPTPPDPTPNATSSTPGPRVPTRRAGARRPVLPARGQRRLRRRPLRPQAVLRPVRASPGRHRDRDRHRDPEPVPVRPRPDRHDRRHGDRRRRAGRVHPQRTRAADHPGARPGPRAPVRRGGHLRRHAEDDRQHPRRVRGGLRLDLHQRRRVRRRRAQRGQHLVPEQRPPQRQGHVQLRDHRAQRASRSWPTATWSGRVRAGRTRPRSTGTRPARWRPTWPPSASGGGRSPGRARPAGIPAVGRLRPEPGRAGRGAARTPSSPVR